MLKALPHRAARLVAAVALVTATTAVGVTGAASPAMALPTNCDQYNHYASIDYYEVRCTSGTGLYRARAYCINDYDAGTTRYGSWYYVGTGYWSRASCNSSYPYLVSDAIEKREPIQH